MDPAAAEGGGMLNLEKELVCFICTEILYQPLTLIDCLHTFCGSCLKSWFQLQHHKACSSHSSSSTATNPYTCPTCRATVKTARPNAMVNTWLELYLAANPARAPTEEDKDEKNSNYKPGHDILPKVVRGRRRERRHRRGDDEATERRMIEEARERSLRDANAPAAPRPELLQPNPAPQDVQHSRSRERDRERDERRARRREVERQRRQRVQESEQEATELLDDGREEEQESQPPVLPPASSPRHPDAVEERQRQQRVMHQASLVSLISNSEGTTGSSIIDSLDEDALRDLIMAEGLYEGIDLNGLTEAEQDILAERVAEAFRRWQRSQQENGTREPPQPLTLQPLTLEPTGLQPDSANRHRSRNRSTSNQRRTETYPPSNTTAQPTSRPRSSRAIAAETPSMPPSAPSPIIVTQGRRRLSNQSQSNVSTRTRSRQSSPRAGTSRSRNNSAIDVSNTTATGTGTSDPASNPTVAARSSAEPHALSASSGLRSMTTASSAQAVPPTTVQNTAVAQRTTSPLQSPSSSTIQLAGNGQRKPRSASRTLSQTGIQALTLFDEPSVSCFRCYTSDIQYKTYKYCETCDVSLCLNCYRQGRGCKYWFGFGPAAMKRFEEQNADRVDSGQGLPLPHQLVGRSLRIPHHSLVVATKLAKDGETTIPLRTMSDPSSRMRQGYFCDRCGAFANSTFYTCDVCNFGEWGFCKDCVNTHHCCTDPLRPIAQQVAHPVSSHRQATGESGFSSPTSPVSEVHSSTLNPGQPGSNQPASATSVMSTTIGPRPGFAYLEIRTNCDQCGILIDPSYLRYHCPFHLAADVQGTRIAGNYDICTNCYHGLVKSGRISREDGPAGWRKCPLGHRMIITAFSASLDGGFWRIVNNDLVGGRRFTEKHLKIWTDILTEQRDAGNTSSPTVDLAEFEARVEGEIWQWRDDQSSDQRTKRQRNLASQALSNARANQGNGKSDNSPNSSRFQFPPEGGFGLRAYARFTRLPEEGDAGKDELLFPKEGEIRELERVNDDFWYGTYAGDSGLVPSGYLRSTDTHAIM